MFIVTKHLHLMLIISCVSLINGCIVRPQQVSLPPSIASPTAQTAAVEPSSPLQRGLKGVIPGPTVIVPGHSIGPVQLGDTREQALALFGEPTEEYNYGENSLGKCKFTEMYWNDLDLDRRGISLYFRDGRVYQLESFTPRFAIADGVTNDMSPLELRRRYSKLRSYVLLHSGGKVDGGKDLMYWVGHSDGIAFGLYNYPKTNKRQVGSVIVFEPGIEFMPKGCIEIPQEWHEIKPFTSEVPEN